MSRLPQTKKTSQEPYTLYKFNPGTCTCSLIEVEPPTSFKPLRKPEIGEYEKQHIEKIKEHGQGLDPETLQSMIQTYLNNVLNSPVDDHPPPGTNAPKTWTGKREEHKEDTQKQEAKTGRMSIDEAEARKNRARDGYNPHGATKKKGLTTTDPGFYKEWTGSRSGYPDEKEIQHQEPKPKEKEPGPKTKAKIIKFPKYPTPPKDWMKYAEKVVGGSNLKPIARQLYRRSKRMYLKNVPHYPKETTRRGCYYFCGVEYLARVAGRAEKTVRMVLKALAEAKLIYIRYHGYKGRGCSIIEVPPNIKLVMRWRREHKG